MYFSERLLLIYSGNLFFLTSIYIIPCTTSLLLITFHPDEGSLAEKKREMYSLFVYLLCNCKWRFWISFHVEFVKSLKFKSLSLSHTHMRNRVRTHILFRSLLPWLGWQRCSIGIGEVTSLGYKIDKDKYEYFFVEFLFETVYL